VNEEEALLLYQAIDKGKSLKHHLCYDSTGNRTLPAIYSYPPFHLAATAAMIKLILLFLKKEGNPSIKNLALVTSLHSVCSRKEQAEDRARLLAW
jgi:hypothetical protein